LDRADIDIHFQPYQLYPDLPGSMDDKIMLNTGGNNDGMDKNEFFKALGKSRGRTPEQGRQIREYLKKAWEAEGLQLSYSGGRWGSSFDAQRLIALARSQGREDEMIEAIYTANHVEDLPLSDWSVLLDAAEKAGVEGAEQMLKSEDYVAEIKGRIQEFRRMGINSVPVLIINGKFPIHGAPEPELLEKLFHQVIEKGDDSLAALAA